jgi:NodT family efflux transporter outer membrane factor (OMF) lipoprotein
MSTRTIIPALLVLALAGCAGFGPAAPDRETPLAIPDSWQAGTSGGWRPGWLDALGDPALTRLVEEAVGNNFELRSAAARMQAARAQARIAGADRLPEARLTAGASRSDRGVNSGTTARGDDPVDNFQLNGQLTWEADLWGRLSDASRAARAQWRAAQADYEAARLSLAANIARRWFDVTAARAQTRLARDTVESFDNNLATIENRYRQGIGEALDVRLARNNLANAEANLAQRRRQQDNLARELETLLGRYPSGAMVPPENLPEIAGPVPPGLPAELLERRADITAARARLRAAGYRLANAEKNRLPGITLTATGGAASDSLRNLLDLDTFIWSLAGDLVQPLFQGGRLAAERDLARADDDEALNNYAQTVLTAFREVEDALDSGAYLAEQVAAARRAATEARAAEELALDQYRRGLTGIITLLESQRRKFNADSALIDIVNLRLQNRINLHLALGGDFRTPGGQQTASSERGAE